MKEKTIFAGDLENREEYIKIARAKFDSYDTSVWKKDYFDNDTGGYFVTERARIAQSEKSKNETIKFLKEQEMCVTLAKNGYAMEHLNDKWGETYDVHMDNIKADLKKTRSHNNIVNYAKDAVRYQGAEMVIFEFEKETEKIYSELARFKSYNIHGKYYFTHKKNVIHDF